MFRCGWPRPFKRRDGENALNPGIRAYARKNVMAFAGAGAAPDPPGAAQSRAAAHHRCGHAPACANSRNADTVFAMPASSTSRWVTRRTRGV